MGASGRELAHRVAEFPSWKNAPPNLDKGWYSEQGRKAIQSWCLCEICSAFPTNADLKQRPYRRGPCFWVFRGSHDMTIAETRFFPSAKTTKGVNMMKHKWPWVKTRTPVNIPIPAKIN